MRWNKYKYEYKHMFPYRIVIHEVNETFFSNRLTFMRIGIFVVLFLEGEVKSKQQKSNKKQRKWCGRIYFMLVTPYLFQISCLCLFRQHHAEW